MLDKAKNIMEHAAFETPLSDEELKELGRLVINCGFTEFLVGIHVSMLLEIGPSARIDLINPMATRRKLEILKGGLKAIPKPETRALVEDACKLIDPTIRARNTLLHGIWGFDADKPDGKPVVVSTKDRCGHSRPAEISKYADSLAIASCSLKNALEIDGGRKLTNDPDRLVIQLA